MDDHVHIYPALLGQYGEHFIGYTKDYGLLRPFALIFFYFIYSVYLASPAVAHLIPFIVHAICGYLIYRILSKYTDISVSALLGILYIVFPFFTEQYAWLAASNATLANLMLLLQLLVVTYEKWGYKKQVAIIAILQLVGVLLYENIFFTCLIVTFLLSRQLGYQIRSRKFLLSAIIINLPSLLYFLTRTFILKPTAASFVREMSGSKLLTEAGMLHVIKNSQSFLNTMNFIFTGEGVRNEYWIGNFVSGLDILSKSWIMTLGAHYIIVGLIAIIWFCSDSKIGNYQRKVSSALVDPTSWLLLAGLSLLPALLLSTIAFPFRVIALPVYMVVVAICLFIVRFFPKVVIVIMTFLVCGSLIFTLNILDNTRLIAEDDDTSFIKIVETINARHKTNNQVNVVIRGMPNSSRTTFDFGQYLASCVSSDWCLQAALNRRTGKVKSVIVNQPDYVIKNVETFVFEYDETRKIVDYVEQ